MRNVGFPALVLSIMLLAPAPPAAAQEGPGGAINPNKDCQTLLTCRFQRGASWRGCVSSYSCRTCRFVTARCSIAGSRNRMCRELRCDWGGV